MYPEKCDGCGYSGPFRICGDGKSEGRIYGTTPDGKVHCAVCCAEMDAEYMKSNGKITLYLSGREIINWPGTLRFRTIARTEGRHNFAGVRYDAWFRGPDGFIWHGVCFGDFTEVIHCKRTKATRLV